MQIIEVVNKRVADRGVPISELGRRTNINYQRLYRALKQGCELRASELVSLSKELELEMSDFYDKSA